MIRYRVQEDRMKGVHGVRTSGTHEDGMETDRVRWIVSQLAIQFSFLN